MKRGLIVLAIFFILALPAMTASETTCILQPTLINQDPYPAIPGEYVKLVFQLSGVEVDSCKGARFEIIPTYPFSLDDGTNPIQILNGNTWITNYKDDWMIGYNVLVDKNALNDEYELKIKYSPGDWPSGSSFEKSFNISVEDLVVDFEIFVNDYNINTRELTFEILNIGKSDIEALTLEIPKQDNLDIKGANKIVVGDLDSNEYTTASFEAILSEKIDIDITLLYTDAINERRMIEKTVSFDPVYFENLLRYQKTQPIWLYVIILIIIAWFISYKIQKNKKTRLKEINKLLSKK